MTNAECRMQNDGGKTENGPDDSGARHNHGSWLMRLKRSLQGAIQAWNR